MRPALIFDLDNTLLPCDHRYTECNEAFGRFASALFGGVIRPEEVVRRLQEIDMKAALNGPGFRRDRYPASMVQTLADLEAELGFSVSKTDRDQAYEIGSRVFSEPYELYPGVREMLLAYKDAGFRMALCTKGDSIVQRELKIDYNGLDTIFDVIDIFEIKKGAAEIGQTAARLGVAAGDVAYMVGDSMRDDIVGGRGAGLRTILVNYAGHAWDYNLIDDAPEPDHVIPVVTDLPSVVPISRIRKRAIG